MNSKQNLIALALGALFLISAIAYYFYDESKNQKKNDPHIHLGQNSDASMPSDAGSATSSSVTGKTVPPNHDALMNIQLLKDQLLKNPNDLEHLIQLGNLLYDSGDFKNAIEPYGKALAINSSNNDVRNDYAVCFFNSGNAEQAIKELNTILVSDEKNITATFNMGIIHSNIGKMELARSYFLKVIKLQPNSEFAGKAKSMLGSLK
ncbi:tetratricopeptide repeat protein [bacterium]|nr:tetratricopeptide repeat protein [bacterium]